jgi:hypothetical protein
MEILHKIRDINIDQLRDYFESNKSIINTEDPTGATPLTAGIASNRYDVVKTLLELGADPNYTSTKATLPLIFAIDVAIDIDDYGDEENNEMPINIIKLLLEYGASLETVDIQEEENALEYVKGRHPVAEQIFNSII